MRERALQAVGIIGLILNAAMCGFSADEAGGEAFEAGPSNGSGPSGGSGTEIVDVLMGGGKVSTFTPGGGGEGGITGSAGGAANGGSGGSGLGGSDGGTGGIEDEKDKLAQCKAKAFEGDLLVAFSVDDSNALASPAYVRDILKSEDGVAPNLDLIKDQEFFNYYVIPYSEPGSEPVGVTAALRKTAINDTTYRLLVGVTTPPAPPRPRVNVSIVVDASVSMGAAGMARARAIVKAIGKSLKAGDVVSLVTWTQTERELKGHIVAGPDDPKLTEIANGLAIDGGSDLHSALTRGYELAEQSYDPVGLNRLILISDGRVTVGPWETGMVEKHAQGGESNKPVLLVGAATGPADGYDEAFMTKLTKVGRGAYVYVSSEAEATRLFQDRFDEVVGAPVFENVKLTVQAPGYFEVPGLNSDDGSTPPFPPTSADVLGRPLAPGDSMTFNQIVTVCHSNVINSENIDPVRISISWLKQGTLEAGSVDVDFSVAQLLDNVHLGIQKAHAITYFAEALRSGTSADLSNAWTQINSLNAGWKPSLDMPGEPDLEEMMALIKRHPNSTLP